MQVLALCDRFKKLPSEIYAESGELLYLIELERMGAPDGE